MDNRYDKTEPRSPYSARLVLVAGDALKGGSSFGNDKDLNELDDEGTKVPKDEVAEYIENNYKKNKAKSFNGF